MFLAPHARAAATCKESSKSSIGRLTAKRTDDVSVAATLTSDTSSAMKSRVSTSPRTGETSPHGRDEIVEIRYGVPGYGSPLGTEFYSLQQLDRGRGVRRTVKSDVDHHIGVEQNHRKYLRSNAAYRASSRSEARNCPRQRDAKEVCSSDTTSRSDRSISDDSDSPRERANRLAAGTSCESMVTVSFCFMVETPT